MRTTTNQKTKSFINLSDLAFNLFGRSLVFQIKTSKMEKYKSYDSMKQRLFELANKEW